MFAWCTHWLTSNDIIIVLINYVIKRKVLHHLLLLKSIAVQSQVSSISIVFMSRTSLQINVREPRMGSQKWTIQKNWQYREHKTKKNKIKTTTQYALDNNIHEPITNNVNTSYKQLQVKTNRTSFLYGNRILHKFGNIFFATGRQCPFPNKV